MNFFGDDDDSHSEDNSDSESEHTDSSDELETTGDHVSEIYSKETKGARKLVFPDDPGSADDSDEEWDESRKSYKADMFRLLSLKGNLEQNLGSLLQAWPPTQEKLIYVLPHKYSENGLALQTLTPSDKAIATALQKVGKQHSFTVLLGIVEKDEFGMAENGWPQRRSDPPIKLATLKMDPNQTTTVYSLSIVDSVKGKGEKKSAEIKLSELMPSNCFRALKKPDQREYEGYDGSHGGQLNVMYRLAALVFWPDKHFFPLAKELIPQSVIFQKFLDLVEAIPESDPKKRRDAKILDLVNNVLASCEQERHSRQIEDTFHDVELGLKMLGVVASLGRLKILQEVLEKFPKWSSDMVPFIWAQCEVHGWTQLMPQMEGTMGALTKLEAVALLTTLIGCPTELDPSSEKGTACLSLLRLLLKKGKPAKPGSWGYDHRYSEPDELELEVQYLTSVFSLCLQTGLGLNDFIQKVPSAIDILIIIGPALLQLKAGIGPATGDNALLSLIRICIPRLEAGLVEHKKKKVDPKESQGAFKCKFRCPECSALKEFFGSDRITQVFNVRDQDHLGKMLNYKTHFIKYDFGGTGTQKTLTLTKERPFEEIKKGEDMAKMIDQMKAKVAGVDAGAGRNGTNKGLAKRKRNE